MLLVPAHVISFLDPLQLAALQMVQVTQRRDMHSALKAWDGIGEGPQLPALHWDTSMLDIEEDRVIWVKHGFALFLTYMSDLSTSPCVVGVGAGNGFAMTSLPGQFPNRLLRSASPSWVKAVDWSALLRAIPSLAGHHGRNPSAL